MYPLYGPPPRAGLYFVKNIKTGQIYVGQTVDLKRRYLEWRTAIATNLGYPNHAFTDALTASDRNDWVFIVVMECPLVDLKRGEEKLVAKLIAKIGPLCLNVPDAGVRKPKPKLVQSGSVPLTEVLDENGVLMSHAQIAERLGISMKAVARRLSRLRRVGRFKFHINDLPARQQRLP